jgi:ubiquitin-activating enzyme E1
LTRLTSLSIQGNDRVVADKAPSWTNLHALTALQVLSLERCSLTRVPSMVLTLALLPSLDLSANENLKLRAAFAPQRVQRLLLNQCAFTAVPQHVSLLTALTCLDLSMNGRLTEGWEHLKPLARLCSLNLGFCGLTSVPEAISALSALTLLDLSHNEELAGGWRHLRPLTRLRRLDVFCVPLPGGQTPSALTGLQHMQLRWKPPTGRSDFDPIVIHCCEYNARTHSYVSYERIV